MKSRREFTFTVTVSAPNKVGIDKSYIRREIRSLINDQCNAGYALDENDIRVRSIKP